MVTNSEMPEKTQRCNFRKISKPLMEKKRRARINVSLEQLKTLLEKHYSQNIRKRKLEKADILELTVKYLKNIQGTTQGIPMLKSAEYQTGFRNCLYGVSQFLLRSEETSENLYLRLLHDLGRTLPAASHSFRTMDRHPAPPRSNPAQCNPGLEVQAPAKDIKNPRVPSAQGLHTDTTPKGIPKGTKTHELTKDSSSDPQPLLFSANNLPCVQGPDLNTRTLQLAERVWRPW